MVVVLGHTRTRLVSITEIPEGRSSSTQRLLSRNFLNFLLISFLKKLISFVFFYYRKVEYLYLHQKVASSSFLEVFKYRLGTNYAEMIQRKLVRAADFPVSQAVDQHVN